MNISKFLIAFLLICFPVWAGINVDYNDANCQAAWLFDANTDPEPDSSGNGNTADLVDAPTFATASPPPGGFSTGYYTVDAGTDHIDCGSFMDFSADVQDWSGVLWIRTTTSGSDNYIWGTNLGTGWYARGQGSANDVMLIKIDDGSDDEFDSGSIPIDSGNWVHTAITLDATNNQFLGYIDGTEDITLTTGAVNDLADTLFIGIVATFQFTGDVDESAIFDRELSSTEINDLMDNGLAPVVVAAAPQVIFIMED